MYTVWDNHERVRSIYFWQVHGFIQETNHGPVWSINFQPVRGYLPMNWVEVYTFNRTMVRFNNLTKGQLEVYTSNWSMFLFLKTKQHWASQITNALIQTAGVFCASICFLINHLIRLKYFHNSHIETKGM